MLPFVLPPEFLGLSRLEPIFEDGFEAPPCTYSETAQNLQRKSEIFSNRFIEKAGEGVRPFGDFWGGSRMTTPSRNEITALLRALSDHIGSDAISTLGGLGL
jgi:hypothetical protein